MIIVSKTFYTDRSSPAKKARLLLVSAPHSTSWLSVIPSTSQGLHLDPIEFRVAIKWCMAGPRYLPGLSVCFCPAHSLNPLGHHALTCKCGGDVLFSDAAASFLQSGHVHGWPFGYKRSRSGSKMDRMISIRSRTRLAVSRQKFIRLRTVSNYAWHACINRNGHERYGRTSVKEQIQLTKVFIASEKEQIQSWLDPSSSQ